MAQTYQPKDAPFSGLTISATTVTSVQTDHAVTGEILEVSWSTNKTGSIYITESGTGKEIFRRNAPSGTGWQVAYPRVWGQDPTTGSIAGATMFPYVTASPLILNAGSMSSGTAVLSVNVRYR